MSNTIFYIYALCEPSNLAHIRYIGKTNNPDLRIKQHIRKSLTGGKPRVCQWIKSLNRNGLTPVMKILGKYENEECAFAAEKHFIKQFAMNGLLTNLTTGGEGCNLWHIPEYRHKMSNLLKERMTDPEYLKIWKIKESYRKRIYWANTENRQRQQERTKSSNKKRWKENSSYRNKQSSHLKAISQKSWSKSEFREKMSQAKIEKMTIPQLQEAIQRCNRQLDKFNA
jgi:hypothetical protein